MNVIIDKGYVYTNRASVGSWSVTKSDFSMMSLGDETLCSLCGVSAAYLINRDKLPKPKDPTCYAVKYKDVNEVFIHIPVTPSIIQLDDYTRLVHTPNFINPRGIMAMVENSTSPFDLFSKLRERVYVPQGAWEIIKVSDFIKSLDTFESMPRTPIHKLPGYVKKRIRVENK